MKRFLIPFAALALLLAGSAFSASVTDVELSHLNNGYVAKIKVTDGPVRFQHQVEEPKNGKPYRVIVDVLSATHELGGQSFGNLPTCPIQQIRTSQFAVTPEKITRIVFDMADAPLYSVSDAEPGFVKVIFTDRNVEPFITWSSSANSGQPAAPAKAEPVVAKASPQPAAKSADEFNDKAQSDKLASLSASESVPVPASPGPKATTRKPAYVAKKEAASTPTVTATPKTAESTPVAKAQPKQDPKTQAVRQVDRPTVVAPTPTPNPHAQTETQPTAAKPKAMPAKDPVKGSASPEKVVAKKAAEDKKVSADVTKPSAPSNTVAKKADPEPAKTVAKKADPTPAKTEPAPSKKVEVAQKPAEPTKKTSRFRRSPTTPTKLKGTMVAEFPKRLVIKYKTRSQRDPFATLIDDTKTYDSPIERRVPNIEGLRLVGIIEADGGTNQALFEDNTGYSYILKSGDKVKKGYVLRVEADRVYFQIFEYGWSRTVALEIEE